MAGWSQSHFLQSLGWATLNSFWQMALLWCLFQAAGSLFKLSASRKYQFSVFAVFAGFAWFIGSFLYYYGTGTTTAVALFEQKISHSNNLLQVLLTSASVAYLALLVIPAYRLFRNWQFVKRIQTEGLQKADLSYRLFIQRIAAQIGIGKKVKLYISEIVTSPLTVGYLKPVILLPVAALNNLSTQQVEAVLLHELSHIRRYDYLVNLVVSVIHTILYFNPFVRLFLKNIEAERENCCDELVLQFGYDRVGYASALLLLEKASARHQVLTLAATGKQYLLTRIEKIIGMEKKNKGMKMNHLAGWMAALLCVVAFNSVLIIREEKRQTTGDTSLAYENLGNPFNFFRESNGASDIHTITPVPFSGDASTQSVASTGTSVPVSLHPLSITMAPVSITLNPSVRSGSYSILDIAQTDPTDAAAAMSNNPNFVQVSLDEVDLTLSKEQKEQVKATVNNTRRILSSQWSKVEDEMADAMSREEKAIAHQQYMKELEKINWKNMEGNMKAAYGTIDWNGVNEQINITLNNIQLDSVQRNYTLILAELNKAKEELGKAKVSCMPIPDASIQELQRARDEVNKRLDSVKALRKKVVKL
jgi:bla regulator protein BlaR1